MDVVYGIQTSLEFWALFNVRYIRPMHFMDHSVSSGISYVINNAFFCLFVRFFFRVINSLKYSGLHYPSRMPIGKMAWQIFINNNCNLCYMIFKLHKWIIYIFFIILFGYWEMNAKTHLRCQKENLSKVNNFISNRKKMIETSSWKYILFYKCISLF